MLGARSPDRAAPPAPAPAPATSRRQARGGGDDGDAQRLPARGLGAHAMRLLSHRRRAQSAADGTILEQSYFFCGVGGSGMTPLALIVQARGARRSTARTARSTRAATPPGSTSCAPTASPCIRRTARGLTRADQTLVVSAAIEETIPDVQAARRVGAPIITRAQLLAQLFNAATVSVGVAGTSGKSTTTAMIGWICPFAGLDPTIVNGAEMKNFATARRAVRQRQGRRRRGLHRRGGRERRLDRALSRPRSRW